MIHRLRINVAPVEKIARDEQEIKMVRNGVLFNHVIPRTEKVFRALFKVVTTAAQMDVRQMEEFHK
jgi:hypothetical protein